MSKTELPASLTSYDIGVLMTQTRQLASDYRQQTGQALPVTEELARFDAINNLALIKGKEEGIDAIDPVKSIEGISSSATINSYLIKGRVIFKGGKARQKLGKLSLQADWNHLLMVIYDAKYIATHIYQIERAVIEQQMLILPKDKRGSMTVAKYKAIGQLVWENSSSLSKNNTSEIIKKSD